MPATSTSQDGCGVDAAARPCAQAIDGEGSGGRWVWVLVNRGPVWCEYFVGLHCLGALIVAVERREFYKIVVNQ